MVKAVEGRCESGFSFDGNLHVIFGKSQWDRFCKRSFVKTPQYGTIFLRELSTQYVYLEELALIVGTKYLKICL